MHSAMLVMHWGHFILKYSSKEEMFNVIENMDQFVHIIID